MDASGGVHHRGGGQSRAAKKRAKKKNKENNDRKRRLDQEQQQRQKGEEDDQDRHREERKRRHSGDHDHAEEEGTAATNTAKSFPDPPADESSTHLRRQRRRKNGEGGGNELLSDGVVDEEESSSSASNARCATTSTTPPTLAEIIRSIVASEGEGGAGKGKGKGGPEAEEDEEAASSVSDLTAEERGRSILRSILHPAVTAEEFYDTYWEKLPLHVSAASDSSSSSSTRSSPSGASGGTSKEGKRTAEGGPTVHHHGRRRLDGLLSLKDIEAMISDECLRYKYDLNVTRCDESTGMRRINFDHNGEDKVGTSRKKNATAPCVGKYDKDQVVDEMETDGGGDEISSSPPEIVDPDVIWPRFRQDGCTIRMLCPQKHVDRLHAVLSTLESEFGCMVGCNAYLTPGRASRGFAPHYDDIEAFVLQVEGRKRWRVYRPINGGETLPRVSSDDFVMVSPTRDSDSDDGDAGGLAAGLTRRRRRHRGERDDGRRRVVDEPVLDVTLGPGDVLYMPRGWIHHAVTPEDERGHSLHLTVSCMQNWAWADLMELIVPEALASAVQDETSTRLREGLPRNFLAYMGAVHDTADGEDIEGLRQAEDLQSNGNGSAQGEKGRDLTRLERRKERLRRNFKEEAKKCINRICREAISMLDAGCDQIGKRFLSDRLPPALTERERSTTNDASSAGIRLMPDTMCRLVREGIARLVLEDGRAVLYHCGDNSREFHGNPLSPMEFELDDAPAIEQLLTTSATDWIRVQDLTHDEMEDKIGIAQALFDEGILSIYQPSA